MLEQEPMTDRHSRTDWPNEHIDPWLMVTAAFEAATAKPVPPVDASSKDRVQRHRDATAYASQIDPDLGSARVAVVAACSRLHCARRGRLGGIAQWVSRCQKQMVNTMQWSWMQAFV
jgi:hypothetical protein